MINDLNWKNYAQTYSESMIKSKKLPHFFDFYDFSKDFDNVYEPAEDTFLMIDCLSLEEEKGFLTGFENSAEIGCGSGLVSACFVSTIISKCDINKYCHYCVDVNKDALDLTKKMFCDYNLDGNTLFFESNLFDYFIKNQIKLDCIIFNPPYVTTDSEELEIAKNKKDISAAWAGGTSGSEVIYAFLEQLHVKIIHFLIFIFNYNRMLSITKLSFICSYLRKTNTIIL